MKILYVVPYVPDKVRVRPYNLIRHLTACGNQVTVLTLSSNQMEEQAAQELRQECAEVQVFPLKTWRALANSLFGALTPDPVQSFYCWQPQLAQRLTELGDPARHPAYDAIHIEHLRGVRYGQHLLKIRRASMNDSSIPVIWDSVDSISYLFEQAARQSQKVKSRLMTWLELARTRRYEGKMAGLFAQTLVTSNQDREALLRLATPGTDPQKIKVLPNGVDLSYFTPDPQAERQPATLVVSGKMSYHANVSMASFLVNQIMPLIWAKLPSVKLVIVGKDPPKEIEALNSHPNISVTGFVPDIRPYLRTATVAVAPLTYGAGIQNKVLEAMACGIPVVTTSKAVSALQVAHGQDLLVADEPTHFADQVLHLLEDPQKQLCIGENGMRYVHKNHNWNNIAGQLEQIYLEAISNR
jgi:polysaccharide biosynthesis protein PslH